MFLTVGEVAEEILQGHGQLRLLLHRCGEPDEGVERLPALPARPGPARGARSPADRIEHLADELR